jgi:hypothetical protein
VLRAAARPAASRSLVGEHRIGHPQGRRPDPVGHRYRVVRCDCWGWNINTGLGAVIAQLVAVGIRIAQRA